MIKITNIKIKADLSDDELFEKIYKKYKINKNDVTERRIIKKSIDARNKADIFYNYSVELECKNENKIKNDKSYHNLWAYTACLENFNNWFGKKINHLWW